MKNQKQISMKNLFSTLSFILLTTVVFGQAFDYTNENPGAMPEQNLDIREEVVLASHLEEEESGRQEATTSNIQYQRNVKTIATNFTGYKIQLLTATETLEDNHAIFSDFGKVTLEEINGMYCYAIGGFNSTTQANDYAERIVAQRFSTYKVVAYENGKRIN